MALQGFLYTASDHGGLGFAGARVDTQGIVDDLLARLRARRPADMDRAPVGAFEFDGDPLLGTQAPAQRCPAQIDLAGFKLETHGVNDVVGEHRDEQVASDAVLLVVEDRA